MIEQEKIEAQADAAFDKIVAGSPILEMGRDTFKSGYLYGFMSGHASGIADATRIVSKELNGENYERNL